MARAFIAVVPPRPVLDAIRVVSHRARARPDDLALPELHDARWTARPQWHLTLQFLGNRVDLDAVAGALQRLACPPFTVRLGGLGAFPRPAHATVLWIGVPEGARELGALAAGVAARVAPLGHATDERDYRPHLTLARLDAPADVRAAIERFGDRSVGEAWTVDRIVLFESTTAAEGPRYRAHARFGLR